MLSHVDAAGRPKMVDVSDKAVSLRTAHARALVRFPAGLIKTDDQGEITSKKGPVFNTAIVAGVMAAKRTHELIPFCHPLGIENCKVLIEWQPPDAAVIDCHVKVQHKTGVEMEALTGASVAALTVYDMCKALSHEITIENIKLVSKAGGQHDYEAGE